MRIRTQLLLAFLLLAVLPLVGIVAFSFFDSRQAIRRAAAAEASELSAEMENRMAATRDRFKARVSEFPWGRVIRRMETEGKAGKSDLREFLAGELGEMAPALEALTFEPVVPDAPLAPLPPPQPEKAPGAGRAAEPTPAPKVAPTSRGPRPRAWRLQISGDRATGKPIADEDPPRIDDSRGAPVFVLERNWESTSDPGDLEAHDLGGPDFDSPDLHSVDLEELDLETEIFENLEAERLEGMQAEIMVMGEGADQVPELGGAAPEPWGPPAALSGDGSVLEAPEDMEAFEAWHEARRLEAERVRLRVLSELEKRRELEMEERSRLVFGDALGVEVWDGDRVLGALHPKLNPERLLARILSQAHHGEDEIPFAVDAEGHLYAADPAKRHELKQLGVVEASAGTSWRRGDWVVAISSDESTGLRLGVARPMGKALRELRASALRNLMMGMVLISLAVLGILPVSKRISSGVREVAEGAERLARGDLETRLPVRGRGELAHLSRSFNSMVLDLKDHQERLLAQERRRRDEEVERQVVLAELERQSRELEEAREFQLSMLPRELPSHRSFEVAAHVETATEVGGDYHDFHLEEDGHLTLAIGDATGHGARAGTMVTVIKSLFSARAGVHGPAAFLTDANHSIRRMRLGRMTMALTLLSLRPGAVTVASAGMPPVLHHRPATGKVEEILRPGMPLGGLAKTYSEQRLEAAPGDTFLLFTDGLPEQPAKEGDPVGYDYVTDLFARLAPRPVPEIAAGLASAVAELTGGAAPQDDMTFLVLRIR